MNKTHHGGKRQGAGRPPGRGNKGVTPRKSRTFRFPADVLERLAQEEDQTALIVRLLRKYYKLKQADSR